MADDPRYRDLAPGDIPTTECLADVVRRVLPYWESAIVPDLRATAEQGGAVLVAAHGNSLRALRKHLEGISDADIIGLEIPTGIPFRYLLDDDLSVHSATFLGDPEPPPRPRLPSPTRRASRGRDGQPVWRAMTAAGRSASPRPDPADPLTGRRPRVLRCAPAPRSRPG